jgi:YHS domain-containing protein
MRKPFVTTGLAFMAVIVLLGAIGVVNGLWSKNLVINGTVETGDLNADWDCAWTNDDEAQGPTIGDCAEVFTETELDAGPDPCTEDVNPTDCVAPEKDVGHCAVTDLDVEPDGPNAGQIAQVEITNAYPSYECTVTAVITNTGTIPFNIIGGNLIIDPANSQGVEPLGATPCGFAAGTQVDSSNVNPLNTEEAISCTVHVKQTAEQGWTYYFAIEVCVAQWNENPEDISEDETAFESCKGSDQHEGPGTPTLTAPHATVGGGG